MLAGLVYLFFDLPARKLLEAGYGKTALALAVVSLALYAAPFLSFVPL